MTDLLGALLFTGFVAVSLFAAWLGRDPDQRQRGVRVFVAYAMLVSTAAGLLHRELWPFSRWQLFAYRYRPPIEALQIRVVDARSTDYDVDRRAWEPMSSLDLHTWLLRHFLALDPEQQGVVARYLLQQANAARDRAHRGERIGVFDRLLGPLRAPLHVVHSPIWSAPGGPPGGPFTGLRIYRDRWDVWARARNPREVERTLWYAYDRR